MFRADDAVIEMQECTPLASWLADHEWIARDVDDMHERILQLVREMHAQGICHRDLHVQNVVVCEGRPMAIDPQLATNADPSKQCYDLDGPASGMPIPMPHQMLAGYRDSGVWWRSSIRGLGIMFQEVYGHLGIRYSGGPG